MAFQLPQLPFGREALEPHISSETLDYHYGKHHQAYVDNLNRLIADSHWQSLTLEDIVRSAEGGIFSNGAQV